MSNYFDSGLSGGKPEAEKKAPISAKPAEAQPEQDAPVATITVHKKADGGHMFKHDAQDGMPPDEHESVSDLAKSLEEKYGESEMEDAEEQVSPGVHEKAGDYLSKALGSK